MTRKEFAIEMTKYAMRDPNNHRDDYKMKAGKAHGFNRGMIGRQ